MHLIKTIGLILIFQMLAVAQTEPKPELIVQTGHSASVAAIAYSPDGRTVATGSADKTVKLWDAASGTEIRTLEGHTDGVSSVAFSPDGRVVAGGGSDYTIKFWSVETGELLRTIKTVEEKWQDRKADDLPSLFSLDGVRSIAFSPDGKTILAGGSGNIKLWDAETGAEIRTFAGHTDAILRLAFSPDGRTIVSSSEDKTVRLWDAASGREIRTFGAGIYVEALAYNPKMRLIAAGVSDGSVKIWDIKDGREVVAVKVGTRVDSVAFSADGLTFAANRQIIKSVAAPPADGVIQLDGRPRVGDERKNDVLLWDMKTGKTMRAIGADSTYLLSALVFSPDNQTIAGGASSGVRMLDVETGVMVQSLSARASFINAMAIDADGANIAVGHNDSTIKLWNIGSGEVSLRTFAGHYSYLNAVKFSPDGTKLASGSRDRSVKLWDVENGKIIKSFDELSSEASEVAFTPDGKTLVGNSDAYTYFWDADSGRELTSKKFTHVAQSIAFSPDGKFWAAGYNFEEMFFLWKTADNTEAQKFVGHGSQVSSVAFSPDGTLLASGSRDKTVKLWKIGSPNALRTLSGHSDWVNKVAFSPDGKTLASASRDRTVKIWDAGNGKLLKTLNGHTRTINALGYTPDGKFIVSGGDDAAIKVWDAGSGRELMSLYAVGATDWLAVTPDGLFDGTPQAWRQLFYRFNNKTFEFAPVEAFFNEFYFPGLVQEILAGRTPKTPVKKLSDIDIRQPEIKITEINAQPSNVRKQLTADRQKIKVKVEITDNGRKPTRPTFPPSSGATDLRIFRNGSLVKIWRGDVFALNETSGCRQIAATGASPKKAVCETDVQIAAGENKFSAYAFNHDNVKSNDSTAAVKGADSLKKNGTLYILAFGVNRYEDASHNLKFAVADVNAVSEEIAHAQNKLAPKPYSETKIIKLNDEQATRKNMTQALEMFSADGKFAPDTSVEVKNELSKIVPATPDDALVIYYAGHGTASKDRFYLIPHDGFPLNGAGEKYYEELYARSVSDEKLETLLETVDAGKILLVIDACNSGQALEAEEKRRGPMNSKGLAQLAYEKGIYILTAAQSFQSALEVSQTADGKTIEHGLLTYSLLEGLKAAKADANADKRIVEREWLNFAVAQVPQLQIETMQRRDARAKGSSGQRSSVVSMNSGKTKLKPEERGLQTPRVFYRREEGAKPFVIAAP